ncbi:hypothetical protein JCM19992_09350 [Thermostilla marina]
MRRWGIRILDPVGESHHLEWLVLSCKDCPDEATEREVIRRYFRPPHEAWAPEMAFVAPVEVRRTRKHVLFLQRVGLRV